MATDKSVLNRIDHLEQMVLELAIKINKITDNASDTVKANETVKDWRKERDEWNKLERDPEHYDERYKPRLDKYLAYVDIDKRSLPGGIKESYLLSTDWTVEFVRTRSSDFNQEKTIVCISGLVDTKTFKRKIVKFILNGNEVYPLSRLDGLLETFQAAIYNLSKGGPLQAEGMHDDPDHDFRKLEIDINHIETVFRVTNIRYSNYGSMEENEPVYEEAFLHPISIVVIDEC